MYFLFFMEWLFLATQPSSIWTGQPLLDRVSHLLIPPLFVAISTLTLWLAVAVVVGANGRGFWVLWVIPALVLAVTSLILADNFTITMFDRGSLMSKTWRVSYAILLVTAALEAWIYLMWGRGRGVGKFLDERMPKLALWLVLTSVLMTSAVAASRTPVKSALDHAQVALKSPPDIFLISADGLESGRMSLYGYGRRTTPYLESISRELTVFPNSFANASRTAGSLSSVLTGRHPLTTRKMTQGDVFRGLDCYRHLPGILKTNGYRTVQIGNSQNVNAFYWNLRSGFDQRNRVEAPAPIIRGVPAFLADRCDTELYHTEYIVQRAVERLLHVFFIRLSEGSINAPQFLDGEKMALITELIRGSSRPLFVQMHLERTHGHVVIDQKATTAENYRRYDEGVLSVDGMLQSIMQNLQKAGRYENCIFVFFSDHGIQYRLHERLPLVMKFPNKRVPVTKSNVQNLDIAPTILDYLGIAPPEWMEGRSLFRPVDPRRVIISVSVGYRRPAIPLLPRGSGSVGGPHQVNAIAHQRFTSYDLHTRVFTETVVPGHTDPWPAERLAELGSPSDIIRGFMADRRYDLSSVRPPPKAKARPAP